MTDLCVIRGPDGKRRAHEIRGKTLFAGRSAKNDIQVLEFFQFYLKFLK